jgi:diacylglycerol O-acyltransferase
MEHLNNLDAAFLHVETAETPMHVGSLHLFELPPGARGRFHERVRVHLAARLHMAPVFHRKLAAMPFDLANPVWIEDDDVDIDHHVRPLLLPAPGSLAQLQSLAGRLHSSLCDRSRPLWEVYAIEGVEGGRAALYLKVHHAACDGKAAMELIAAMFDTAPEGRTLPALPPRQGVAPYQLGAAELAGAAVANFVRQYASALRALPGGLKAGAGWLQHGAAALPRRAQALPAATQATFFAPRTLFNRSVTNQRSVAGGSVPLAEAKALARRAGATLNDVVLAACGAALREHLQARGALPPRDLVAAVPVSLRSAGDAAQNNQVGVMRLALATGSDDPVARLHAIRDASAAAKERGTGLANLLPRELPWVGTPWIVGGLTALYGRSGLPERLPPLANVLISNVPGPRAPLYLAGARMLSYWPTSVPVHGLGLNITVISCADRLDIGITACRRMLPLAAARELVQGIEAAFAALQAALPAGPEEAPGDAAKAAPRARRKGTARRAATATPT